MLEIRSEQLQVLRSPCEDHFVQRLVQHLQRAWPQRCEALAASFIRESARVGIERAQSYGFITERHIAQYVDLMYALDWDFDTDSNRPWAASILRDLTLSPQSKMEHLYQHARRELKIPEPKDTV